MKIQINSLEALERLIGGDTDMEIQVRNSVVQAFTNKHLKGIAKEHVEKGLPEAVKNYASKELFTWVGGWNSHYKLSDDYKPIVRQMIDKQIRQVIREEVTEQTETSTIKSIVQSYINMTIEKEVNKLSKELIEEEAKKQIKAKFG